jgi:hypothetical protein
MPLADLFALRGACAASGLPRVHHVAELDLFFTRAKQHGIPDGLGQRFKGLLNVKFVVPGQTLQQGEVVAVAPVPALDGAAGQTQGRKGQHPRRVKKLLHTQAVAGRAGTHRRVERKQARLQLLNGVAARRAGEFGVEQVLVFRLGIHLQRNRAAIGQAQGGLEALGQTLLQVVMLRSD